MAKKWIYPLDKLGQDEVFSPQRRNHAISLPRTARLAVSRIIPTPADWIPGV